MGKSLDELEPKNNPEYEVDREKWLLSRDPEERRLQACSPGKMKIEHHITDGGLVALREKNYIMYPVNTDTHIKLAKLLHGDITLSDDNVRTAFESCDDYVEENTKSANKGIQPGCNNINSLIYLRCLFFNSIFYAKMQGLKYRFSRYFKYDGSKIGLSPIYIKRVVQNDGIHTEPLNLKIDELNVRSQTPLDLTLAGSSTLNTSNGKTKSQIPRKKAVAKK